MIIYELEMFNAKGKRTSELYLNRKNAREAYERKYSQYTTIRIKPKITRDKNIRRGSETVREADK